MPIILLTKEHHPQGKRQTLTPLTLSGARQAGSPVTQRQSLAPGPDRCLTVSALPHGRATAVKGHLLLLSAQQTLLLLQAPPLLLLETTIFSHPQAKSE